MLVMIQIGLIMINQPFGLFGVKFILNSDWGRNHRKVHNKRIYNNPQHSNILLMIRIGSIILFVQTLVTIIIPTWAIGLKTMVQITFCNLECLIHKENMDYLLYSMVCVGIYQFEDTLYELSKGECESHVFDSAKKGYVVMI